MTKEAWVKHIEFSENLDRPSLGGDKDRWIAAVRRHAAVGCIHCAARARTRRATMGRKAMDQARLDAGLRRGRTGLGRLIWE